MRFLLIPLRGYFKKECGKLGKAEGIFGGGVEITRGKKYQIRNNR